MRKISVDSSNALEHFDATLGPVLRAKRVVVLLDYDGTLTPIVNDPAKALLPSRTRDILVELAERCVVGIVSGCVSACLPDDGRTDGLTDRRAPP